MAKGDLHTESGNRKPGVNCQQAKEGSNAKQSVYQSAQGAQTLSKALKRKQSVYRQEIE